MILTVDYGEFEFTEIDSALSILSEYYGYDGPAWDMVVSQRSLEVLVEFLKDDGIHAVLEEL